METTDKSKTKSVTLSVQRKKGKLCLTNNLGQEWNLPKGFSQRLAVSALVYGALMNNLEDVEIYASKYRVSIKIEILDE